MVKKMKKYAKFVVCMGLILGLMAPSYAALSASDGSAFVTKAEFDSALADFNARLTTFEAGINSKIDSQVTSYLDRNGIWSGKDQLASGTTSALFSYGKSANKGAWPAYLRTAKTEFVSGVQEVITEGKDTLIGECTKSGLLYLHSRYGHQPFVSDLSGATDFALYYGCDRSKSVPTPVTGGSADWAQGITWPARAPYALQDWRIFTTSVALELSYLKNGESMITRNILSSMDLKQDISDGSSKRPIALIFNVSNGEGSDFMFVQAKDKVELRYRLVVTPNTQGCATLLTWWFYNVCYFDKDMQCTQVIIDQMKVY